MKDHHTGKFDESKLKRMPGGIWRIRRKDGMVVTKEIHLSLKRQNFALRETQEINTQKISIIPIIWEELSIKERKNFIHPIDRFTLLNCDVVSIEISPPDAANVTDIPVRRNFLLLAFVRATLNPKNTARATPIAPMHLQYR